MKWEPAEKYKRKPLSFWQGQTVKLLRSIENRGGGVMPKGSLATVEDKRGGLALYGSGTYTTRVDYQDLLLSR